MDLSKRANLLGVREVRGLVLAAPDSPTGVTGADWADLIELRADGESDAATWTFRGAASIVDHDYTVRDMFGEFTERIAAGAFDKTLSENPDVMLNYMHDPATTMVTTRGGGLKLSADPHLTVEATVPKSDMDAQRVMPKVQRGDASSMSFAFRVTQQVWNEDYTDRTITEVNLHRGDVAVIVSGLGANPAAWGTVRGGLDPESVRRFLESQTVEGLGTLVDGLESDGWFVSRSFRSANRDGADAALLALRAGTASPDQITMLAGLVCSSIDMADDAFDSFLSALGIPDPDAVEDANEQNSGLDSEFLKQLVAVQLRSRAA